MQAHKDLSSDLYHPHKNPDMVALICNSRSEKAETGGSLGCYPASLVESVSSRFSKRPCFKKKSGEE